MQNFIPMLVLTGKDGFVTNNQNLHKWQNSAESGPLLFCHPKEMHYFLLLIAYSAYTIL